MLAADTVMFFITVSPANGFLLFAFLHRLFMCVVQKRLNFFIIMVYCAAFGCNNRSTDQNRQSQAQEKKLKWHSFPSNVKLRKAWIHAVRRKHWTPSRSTRLCSEHFTENDYFTVANKKSLTASAIPSVFPAFPDHLKKPVSQRKAPVKRDLFPSHEPSKKKKRKVVSDISPQESTSSALNPDLSSHPSPPNTSFACENNDINLQGTSSTENVPALEQVEPSSESIPSLLSPSSHDFGSECFASECTLYINDTSISDESRPDCLPSDSERDEILLSGLLNGLNDASTPIIEIETEFPDNTVEITSDPETTNVTEKCVHKFEYAIHSYCLPHTENGIFLGEESDPSKNTTSQHTPRKTPGTYRKRPNRAKAKAEETPRKKKLRQKIAAKDKAIKNLRMRVSRKTKRVAKLTSILKFMKQRNYAESDDLQILKDTSGPHEELIERQLRMLKCKKKNSRKYGPELRTFALTLNYLSPRGYKYVRKTFHCSLPHPKTIYKWYRTIDGSPGFTSEAFNAVEAKIVAMKEPLIAALQLDEMSIRKLVESDGRRKYGYVDYGAGGDSDSTEIANSALVIMLVAVNSSWKIPLGYFLVSRINASQKANLVRQCLHYLHEKNVKITGKEENKKEKDNEEIIIEEEEKSKSRTEGENVQETKEKRNEEENKKNQKKSRMKVVGFTSDAPATNIAMFRELGCNFDDPKKLKNWFLHPDTKEKIYIFFDACHMLKLVRNTIGDKQVLYDPDLGYIKWEHFANLHALQQEVHMHLANKVNKKHIFFKQKIMNVRLAAQTLSRSTADALQFLKDNKVEGFEDSAATIKFARMFDSLFDILNSKNMLQPGFKKPMNPKNFPEIEAYLQESKAYILKLKCSKNGGSILNSARHTGFLGFLVDIESILKIYESLCSGKSPTLDFLPAYKFSQDHLEIFFGCIRMCGGHDNNPTARKFCNAYKKNLIHMELKVSSNSNCTPLENITILTCSSKSTADPEKCINISSCQALASWHEPVFQKLENEFDDISVISEITDEHINHYFNITTDPKSSKFTLCIESIVAHISGCIVKILKKRLKCIACTDAMTGEAAMRFELTMLKDRGGLHYCSEDVLVITRLSEKVLRIAFPNGNFEGTSQKFSAKTLTNEVLKLLFVETETGKRLFKKLDSHLLDLDPLHNHKFYLIKAIATKYMVIRTHYMCKNALPTKVSKRQIFNKLVLFSGQ